MSGFIFIAVVVIVMISAFMSKPPPTPQCPYCGCSTRKMGPLTRAEFGTGGIGKSYICNNCRGLC